MGRLVLAAATAFVIGSPTCDRIRETGNHFKSLAAHYFSMPEPGVAAFKSGKREENRKAAERLKGAKLVPVENYVLVHYFKNDYTLEIDKKRKMARVKDGKGETIAEGGYSVDPKTKNVSVETGVADDFDYIFNPRGSFAIVPKIGKE